MVWEEIHAKKSQVQFNTVYGNTTAFLHFFIPEHIAAPEVFFVVGSGP
jgi:hypothetical protein